MFFPEGQIRMFLYGRPVDMRKSFTGLYALTKHALGENPLSGDLYAFINRRGNYLKALYWDRRTTASRWPTPISATGTGSVTPEMWRPI